MERWRQLVVWFTTSVGVVVSDSLLGSKGGSNQILLRGVRKVVRSQSFLDRPSVLQVEVVVHCSQGGVLHTPCDRWCTPRIWGWGRVIIIPRETEQRVTSRQPPPCHFFVLKVLTSRDHFGRGSHTILISDPLSIFCDNVKDRSHYRYLRFFLRLWGFERFVSNDRGVDLTVTSSSPLGPEDEVYRHSSVTGGGGRDLVRVSFGRFSLPTWF